MISFSKQGEDEEWRLHWRHLGLNPFLPDRTPLPTPPTSSAKPRKTTETGNPNPPAQHPNTATNQLKISVELTTLPPLPELVGEITTRRPSRSLPSFLSQKYQDFCELQSMAYSNACCPVDLFEHPEAESLGDMGCEAFVIPEAMVGSIRWYYNPLFITEEERSQLETNGSVVKILK